MISRNLGHVLGVSALGLGCMPMTGLSGSEIGTYGVVDRAEATATIHRAIELGVTFFDTAEMYGPYTNEILLGEAICGKRDGLVIATKFGWRVDEKLRVVGMDGSPENARRVCESSLRRLGVDVIDLFYQHRLDPAIRVEETVGGMARLVEEGKIRAIGFCELDELTLRRAHAVHPISALQSEYSLWERGVEATVLPVTEELGIGFVPYSPLGRGFLTGAITSRASIAEGDHRTSDPRYDDAHFTTNLQIVEQVQAIAARLEISPARIALAWLLHKGKHIVPIPGSKRRVTMQDSMAAANVMLSDVDIKALETAAPVGGVAGDRKHRVEVKAADAP